MKQIISRDIKVSQYEKNLFGENYILAMGVKVFGSNRLEIENISFRSIFDHLFCYLHLID